MKMKFDQNQANDMLKAYQMDGWSLLAISHTFGCQAVTVRRTLVHYYGEQTIRKGRGTAAMRPEDRQRIARLGGLAVSKDRARMAEIGRKGGATVSKDKEYMATIGRKGGAAIRSKFEGEENA